MVLTIVFLMGEPSSFKTACKVVRIALTARILVTQTGLFRSPYKVSRLKNGRQLFIPPIFK